MRSDADRVTDILEAIAKIKQRIPGSLDSFLGDEMVQVWAIHHLQLIGEAGRCVSESLRDRSSRGAVAANRRASQHPGPRILRPQPGPSLDHGEHGPARARAADTEDPGRTRGPKFSLDFS